MRSCGSLGTPLPAELDAEARAGAMCPCSEAAHVKRSAWSMAPAPTSSSPRMSSGVIGSPAASESAPVAGVVDRRVPDGARGRRERGHPRAPEDVVDLVELAVADVEGEAMVVAAGGRIAPFDDRVGRERPRVGIGLRVVVEARRGDRRGIRGHDVVRHAEVELQVRVRGRAVREPVGRVRAHGERVDGRIDRMVGGEHAIALEVAIGPDLGDAARGTGATFRRPALGAAAARAARIAAAAAAARAAGVVAAAARGAGVVGAGAPAAAQSTGGRQSDAAVPTGRGVGREARCARLASAPAGGGAARDHDERREARGPMSRIAHARRVPSPGSKGRSEARVCRARRGTHKEGPGLRSIIFGFSHAVDSTEIDFGAFDSVMVTLLAIPAADGDPMSLRLRVHFVDGRVLDETFSASATTTRSNCSSSSGG